jgi:hypothetical protein
MPRHMLLAPSRARCPVLLLLLQGSVREQLEMLCDLSPVCPPVRLKRQKQVITQLQSDNRQLRSDNQQLEMENTALQLQHSQANIQGQ